MNHRVTLDQVAAHVGVSRQTVSRVINGKAEVRDATRERIMQAIDELGYRPNMFARGLVTRRSHAIGLVVGDIANPFFPDVARGVQDVAERNGYSVFVCNFGGEHEDEIDALRALAAQGADGCIFFSSGRRESTVQELADTYSTLVAVNVTIDHPSVSSVLADLYGAGRQVADHLLERGRSKFAVIAADYDIDRQARVTGFLDRAADAGVPVRDEALVFAPPTTDGAISGVRHLLDRGIEFDAIFAFNDLGGVGVLQTLAEVGIAVPEDCAVVGCDDLALCEIVRPTLTSIHMDRYVLGVTAMEHLLARLSDADAPSERVLQPTSLSIRDSSQAASPATGSAS